MGKKMAVDGEKKRRVVRKPSALKLLNRFDLDDVREQITAVEGQLAALRQLEQILSLKDGKRPTLKPAIGGMVGLPGDIANYLRRQTGPRKPATIATDLGENTAEVTKILQTNPAFRMAGSEGWVVA